MQTRQIEGSDSPPADLRVAFLTNLIPPYQKPLFVLLSRRYSAFRLLISTAMESNRPWLPEWSGLDVVVQKGITLRRRWSHPSGFEEPLALHLPTDTIAQLARFHPHVVVSVEMGFRTLLAYIYTRLHPGCRFIIWTEETDITERGRGKLRDFVRRFFAPRAHAFLAVGSAGVRYIVELGASRPQVFEICYSTTLEPFTGLALDRQGSASTHLLFCGQLIERKGLQPFLEALGRWAAAHPERRIEFSLVGDGPARAPLSASPLPANVKLFFIGTLQYNQLPEIYAASGIFVLPTLADTWAVAVNEAMASGLPVLGSVYSQAVQELVQDGQTGWTFRPDHPGEMDSALQRALSSSETELNRMRARARQRSLQVTPEKAAAVCAEAIHSVLGLP